MSDADWIEKAVNDYRSQPMPPDLALPEMLRKHYSAYLASLKPLAEMAEGIAEAAVPFLTTDKGKQDLYPLAGINVDGYAWAIGHHLAPLYAELERLRAEVERLKKPDATKFEPEPKPDWRIGLTVKAKYRSDPLYYERGKVVDVHGSGFYGIDDKDGVLRIKLDSGNVILSAADKWVTA